MSNFYMVKYHNRQYPDDIPLRIEEVAGHFDSKGIYPQMNYSLHTEYSFGTRYFNSPVIYDFEILKQSSANGIPMLWSSKEWSCQFADFIFNLCEGKTAPSIIEIHPPFSDYTAEIKEFINIYKYFDEKIKNKYPNTKIFIENRCGSRYKAGNFIISQSTSLIELTEIIIREKLDLRITLDIPQLYSAHNITPRNKEMISGLLDYLRIIREYISGIHLWGKKKGERGIRKAHFGDLNTYFMGNSNLKHEFLESLKAFCDDDITRYLVLEVNSNDSDILSIIDDLKTHGFSFKEGGQ